MVNYALTPTLPVEAGQWEGQRTVTPHGSVLRQSSASVPPQWSGGMHHGAGPVLAQASREWGGDAIDQGRSPLSYAQRDRPARTGRGLSPRLAVGRSMTPLGGAWNRVHSPNMEFGDNLRGEAYAPPGRDYDCARNTDKTTLGGVKSRGTRPCARSRGNHLTHARPSSGGTTVALPLPLNYARPGHHHSCRLNIGVARAGAGGDMRRNAQSPRHSAHRPPWSRPRAGPCSGRWLGPQAGALGRGAMG